MKYAWIASQLAAHSVRSLCPAVHVSEEPEKSGVPQVVPFSFVNVRFLPRACQKIIPAGFFVRTDCTSGELVTR